MVRPLTVGVVVFVVLSTGAVTFCTAAPMGENGSDSESTGSVVQHPLDHSTKADPAATLQTEQRQFDLRLRNVSSCGVRCRDVTVTGVNTGETTVRDVKVVTRLEANGHVIWLGSESVERLDPGESATVTKRVLIGPWEALQILRNDGYVTVNTTVTWTGGRETFKSCRKVVRLAGDRTECD